VKRCLNLDIIEITPMINVKMLSENFTNGQIISIFIGIASLYHCGEYQFKKISNYSEVSKIS